MLRRKPATEVTQKQFDDAARALYAHVTGKEPPKDFVKLENDAWFALARVALEGAGVKCP